MVASWATSRNGWFAAVTSWRVLLGTRCRPRSASEVTRIVATSTTYPLAALQITTVSNCRAVTLRTLAPAVVTAPFPSSLRGCLQTGELGLPETGGKSQERLKPQLALPNGCVLSAPKDPNIGYRKESNGPHTDPTILLHKIMIFTAQRHSKTFSATYFLCLD